MGTRWSVLFHANDPLESEQLAELDTQLAACLQEINRQMSTWDATSLISQLNTAEKGWYALPDAFFVVVDTALQLAEQTQGAYDPTLGELVNLWGFGPAGPVHSPPEPKHLRTALLCSGWKKTVLNRVHRAIWQPGGLQFDFSSIAKGYAVDEMANILMQTGVEHFLIELGGEMKAHGYACTSTHRLWRVDIQHAETLQQPEGLPILLNHAALASSGDYLRHFTYKGKRYSHTLDGRSGQPITNNLAAVSVIHDSAMHADALATALQCLGPNHGWHYAQQHQLAALFLIRHKHDDEVKVTPAFRQLAGLA